MPIGAGQPPAWVDDRAVAVDLDEQGDGDAGRRGEGADADQPLQLARPSDQHAQGRAEQGQHDGQGEEGRHRSSSPSSMEDSTASSSSSVVGQLEVDVAVAGDEPVLDVVGRPRRRR